MGAVPSVHSASCPPTTTRRAGRRPIRSTGSGSTPPSSVEPGPVTALRPQPAAPRVWVVAAFALVIGILGTLGVVSVVGTFTDPSTNSESTPARRRHTRWPTPSPSTTLVTSVGRSIVTISVAPAGGGEATAVGSGVVVGAGSGPHRRPPPHQPGSVSTVITVGSQVAPAQGRSASTPRPTSRCSRSRAPTSSPPASPPATACGSANRWPPWPPAPGAAPG